HLRRAAAGDRPGGGGRDAPHPRHRGLRRHDWRDPVRYLSDACVLLCHPAFLNARSQESGVRNQEFGLLNHIRQKTNQGVLSCPRNSKEKSQSSPALPRASVPPSRSTWRPREQPSSSITPAARLEPTRSSKALPTREARPSPFRPMYPKLATF